MTHIYRLLPLALTFMLSLISCSSSSSDNPGPSTTTGIEVVDDGVVADGLTFSKAASSRSFSVRSSFDVKAESSAPSWCHVSAGTRTTLNNVTKITVDVDANPSTDTRSATVTISGGKANPVTVRILQGESAGLTIESVDASMPVSAEGATVSVRLKSTAEPTVTPDADWISVLDVRSMTERTVRLTVAPNPSSSERSASVKFTLDGVSESLQVSQQGGSGSAIDGSNAAEIARSLGLGWNLGNQMDAYVNNVADEKCWGNPKATQALFNALKTAGISTVRIPVTWLGKVGAAPDYKIDEAWLSRVAELVSYAESAGLNAIVNIHHDGGKWLDIKKAANDANFNAGVKAQLKAMWTQIAKRFESTGSFLMFETVNEIHDGGWGWGDNRNDGGKQYATLNEWNQTVVDAVRAVGGQNATRWIGIPSYCTNIDYAVDDKIFKLPSDPASRLMVAVHFYDPYEYTLNDKYSEWGHTADKSKKNDGMDEDNVRNVLSRLKTAFIDRGIPVYFGEMGCVHRSTERAEAFRIYYLEYVTKACHDVGVAPIYWDNGSKDAGTECSGLFNRSTGAFLNNGADVVAAMVRGATSNEAGYTLQLVYNTAP